MKKNKWTIKKSKEAYVISEDAAHAQIMLFLEKKNIDIDIYEDKERKQFEMVLEKLSQQVRLGLVVFEDKNGKIEVVQRVGGPTGDRKNDLIYSNYNGRVAEESDGFDEKQNNSRINKIAGALTGIGSEAIKDLSDQDYSVTQCVVNLFLSV